MRRAPARKFGGINPAIQFSGSFHGRCGLDGRLEGGAEPAVMADLERIAPDYIWVGFGTPKQQAWVRQHRHLIKRGVILTVGFAFDVNAGMKATRRCGCSAWD